MKFLSWNPSQDKQFVQYLPSSQLELLEIADNDVERRPIVIDVIPNNSITCFEWQFTQTQAALAYGTSSGTVSLVNWEKHKEVIRSIVSFVFSLSIFHPLRQFSMILRLNDPVILCLGISRILIALQLDLKAAKSKNLFYVLPILLLLQ